MFGHIVPCGIAGKEVTSLEAEGVTVEHGRGGGGRLRGGDRAVGGREAGGAAGCGDAGVDEGGRGGTWAGAKRAGGECRRPRSGQRGSARPRSRVTSGQAGEQGQARLSRVKWVSRVKRVSRVKEAPSGCRVRFWARSTSKIDRNRAEKRKARPEAPLFGLSHVRRGPICHM